MERPLFHSVPAFGRTCTEQCRCERTDLLSYARDKLVLSSSEVQRYSALRNVELETNGRVVEKPSSLHVNFGENVSIPFSTDLTSLP